MQTIKLHEATKQFGISNKLAMFFLEKKNIPVKSHSSVITIDQLELLREFAANQGKFKDFIKEFDNNEIEIEKEKKLKTLREKTLKPEDDIEKDIETEVVEEPKPVFIERIEPVPPEIKHKEPEFKPKEPEFIHKEPEIKPIEHDRKPQAHEPKHEPKHEQKHEPKHEPKLKEPEQKVKDERQKEFEARPKDQSFKPRPPGQHFQKPGVHQGQRFQKPGAPPQQPRKDFQPPVKPVDDKTPIKKEELVPNLDKGLREGFKPNAFKKDKNKPKIKKEFIQEHEIIPDVPVEIIPGVPVIPVIPPKKDFPPRKEFPPKKEYPQKRDFHKKDRYDNRRTEPQKEIPRPKPKEKIFNLPGAIQTSNFINIKELAEKLNIKLRDIEERMRTLGKEYMTNQFLSVEEINEICSEFKVEVDIISYEDDIFYNHIREYKAEKTSKAPVVTIMGHVDHGKTTLLDTLRKTRVAEKEAGGITQKIGAYKLTYNGNDLIFIDTPGHEAFTNIRARGAQVTDIVVLVVAANDGVQPQTIEAIHHARAAGVPIVVAINKIDMEGADSTRVKQQLSKHEIVVEEWGGDVVSVEISAKHNKNLDALLEMLNIVSEMLELKAYKSIPARGVIIESRLDPQLGPLGTVLIQHGQLKRGDFFICGDSVGRVKSIFDDHGKTIADAEVPLPIEIMGFEEIPEAGQFFQVTTDIEKARKVIDLRKQTNKEARIDGVTSDKKVNLLNLFEKMGEDKTKEFPIIIKTDNFSSCEVLEKILLKQDQVQIKVNIIHKGVGNITESDILLAATSGAIIIGFNVKAPQKLIELAKRNSVDIRLYNVIYHLIEEFGKAIKGEMAPEYIERFIGKAEVLQIFKISKIGIIAGCIVKDGKVTNKSKIKVIRKNDLVFEGEIETLRRVKNEASEVNAGTECGIRIKNFNSIEPGDTLEIYEVKLKV